MFTDAACFDVSSYMRRQDRFQAICILIMEKINSRPARLSRFSPATTQSHVHSVSAKHKCQMCLQQRTVAVKLP